LKNSLNNNETPTHKETQQSTLRAAIERALSKLVSCEGCTKCCEKGIAYVLPEEKEHLELLGVPLIEIDGIYFIKRKKDGSCSMLDKENRQCSIYSDRPMCCRAFPLDVFSRRGRLEWGIYTYCPTDRLVTITGNNRKASVDFDVVCHLASSLEKHITEDVLDFLEREDRIVAKVELLDEHRNDFKILGPVLKKRTK
jgi:Fe-S-cluster containining protein